MDFSNYTDRARGFVQNAQTLALARGHQRITTEHVAKALLDDEEGLAANLIKMAGGDAKAVLSRIEEELTNSHACRAIKPRSTPPPNSPAFWKR